MDLACQHSEVSVRYLHDQLNIARKEINNLRQQLRSLRYIHEKDVDTIKRLLESYKNVSSIPEAQFISSDDVKPSTSTDDGFIKLKPIGIISTWFPSKRGTPRQPGICAKVPGKLLLYNSIFTNPDHALEGLQDFSHMWILFYFHRNESTHVRAKVAPPRLNGTKTGVFSTRSPHRPCPIGLSLVKITKIENYTIHFEGVDMINQSPVLDIKPYIPQYDSPLCFEKLNNVSQQSNFNDTFQCIGQSVSLNRNRRFDTFNDNVNVEGERQCPLMNSYYQESYNETNQGKNVSRDEEIALRLQTEEFQRNSNFENDNNTAHFSESSDTHLHNNSALQPSINVRDTLRASYAFLNALPDTRSSINFSSQLAQESSESLSDINSRLQNINVSGSANSEPAYVPDNIGTNYVEAHAPPSRLLDGADGPSTVCGTDLDLIQRRSLNSRIDNSPIRMGIREAPDGEEGLEPQTLNPIQMLPNTQILRSLSNSSLLDNVDINSVFASESRSAENREVEVDSSSEVRIPEWISRPRTPLRVVFNDRALIQLNEILGSKMNDQKIAIENVLCEDPRSVYLRQRWGSQFYTFLIHDLHITCRFDDNRGVVTVFQVRHAGRICECGEPEWQCLGHSPPPS